MGDLLERNLDALCNRYNDIIAYLNKPSEEKKYLPEEQDLTVEVRDVCGRSVMCAQKGERLFRLDSLYDSSSLLDVWFSSFGGEWDLGAKLIMYGLGNGMYARHFLEKARSDCSIVIHEPSEKMFRAAIENFDMSDLFADPRVRMVFWPLYREEDEIKMFYEQIIEYMDLASHKMAYYGNYPRIFPNDSLSFTRGIGGARDYAIANQIVHERFGADYNRNTFNNLKFIPDSLSYSDLIEKMPEDIPAIVVAAGPSLDKNIHDLKAAKGKCIIISTDTALKPLALAGIEADLAVIVDGKKDARYMEEELSKHVTMLCTPRSGDTFMNLHEGPKIFTNNLCNHIKSFMDANDLMFVPLSTGGSVANSCFGLAEALGCKRIILVGQDLAYTGDKTHSKVTVRGAKHTAVEDLEHVIMGVDINGDPIRTSREFKMYREWFEDEIKSHPDLKVIDATEGGVKIEGTELMTLKDAIARECTKDFDFKSVLDKIGPLLDKDTLDKFRTFVLSIPTQMDDINKMIDDSASDYKKMRKMIESDDYHNQKFIKLYRHTGKMCDEIENSPVIEYVHNQLQERSSRMLDKVNKLEDDEKTELLTAVEIGENYLKDMKNAVEELAPFMDAIKSDFSLGSKGEIRQ